jgi:hypothetical protein
MAPSYKAPIGTLPLDLRSSFRKLNWAKEHIDNLGRARVSFLGRNSYYGIPKFNPETNRTQFILQSVPDIPSDIPLLLGDAAHNLRTALDHLASALARSNNIPDSKVYFPICETADVYKAKSEGKAKGIPPEAKKLIDRLKPHGGDDGNHLLWGLHQLDIIDKHRLVLTTTLKTGGWSVSLNQSSTEYRFEFLAALKTGDIIGDVVGKSDRQMSITPDIAFGEPEAFAGEAIFPTMTILAQYVGEIIGMFGNDSA